MENANSNLLAHRWPFWRCVRWGFYLGCGYSALALMAHSQMDGFEMYYGLSILQVIAIDLLGGTGGGAIVGVLLPRASGPIGYIATASAAVTPAYVLFALSTPGLQPQESILGGITAAVVVGTYLGIAVWIRQRKNR